LFQDTRHRLANEGLQGTHCYGDPLDHDQRAQPQWCVIDGHQPRTTAKVTPDRRKTGTFFTHIICHMTVTFTQLAGFSSTTAIKAGIDCEGVDELGSGLLAHRLHQPL
jgi:hypothetical protein